MTDVVSQNYATALFGLLAPSDREEAMGAMASILEDMREEPDFARLLTSRGISLAERRDVLDNVYGKRYGNIPHFLPFLKVVSDHHRLGRLQTIYDAFRSLHHAELGVKEGIAYSAERLSQEELDAISQSVSTRIGTPVSLHNVIDHRLLGGVKVAVDGKVFDGTLVSKLRSMASTLKGGIPS
ncbi:MAG: ATP synthase F1 subunit delta [Bacilli bacterium]|nr:ATP synthase F1 subunit delta [Bacilli bacterium]